MKIFIFLQPTWRDGRVVECTGLENQRTAMYRGFESLSLRKRKALSFDWAFFKYNIFLNMKLSFRIIALLEGVSYILLMTFGLYFKYQLNDDSYVKLLGMPHGILFILYIIFAFLLRKKENWNLLNFGVILFASLIPFGTFYIDRKYL